MMKNTYINVFSLGAIYVTRYFSFQSGILFSINLRESQAVACYDVKLPWLAPPGCRVSTRNFTREHIFFLTFHAIKS